MMRTMKTIMVVTLAGLPPGMKASTTCKSPAFMKEQKDVATIQRLEAAWTEAYFKANTEFMRCLLTPDFTEIMRNGSVKVLADELGFAEANRGKNLPIPVSPKGIVLLQENTAVAYGTTSLKQPDGHARSMRYADYYLWENDRWHVYFAQQTTAQDETRESYAADYFELKLVSGQKFGNVFSKTVSYSGESIDDTAQFVAGSALYEVLDASPESPKFSVVVDYDGHKTSQGTVEIRDHGRETCSLGSGKCSPYTDDSGPVYDAFLWGMSTRTLAPGVSWEVQLPVAWELGPAATQIVTVERVDLANGEVVLRREGEGEGAFADEDKQIRVKKAGKEFIVDAVPGKSHWVGTTVFQRGVTVSDELQMTQSLTVSSKDFGQAVITERQCTLLNQAPAESLGVKM
ncbi:MAG: nuclear transport factor 2 family protein [Acidobacteriaceae bacterium]